MTPFRFFATVLGPDGGRRAFRARLGGEADDVLDTFSEPGARLRERRGAVAAGFRRASSAPTRATSSARPRRRATGVRVMTVHGAKGLEADVVFLADTGGLIVVPGQRDMLVADRRRPRRSGVPLAAPQGGSARQSQRDADAREDEKTEREYLRLLYVAMTRARDVLYVAGIKGVATARTEPAGIRWLRDALVPEGRRARSGERRARRAVFMAAAAAHRRSPRRPDDARGARRACERSRMAVQARAAVCRAPPQPLRPSQALAEPDSRTDLGAMPAGASPASQGEALDARPRRAPAAAAPAGAAAGSARGSGGCACSPRARATRARRAICARGGSGAGAIRRLPTSSGRTAAPRWRSSATSRRTGATTR